MTKIAFQPAGDPISESNLEKSLYQPVILTGLNSLAGTRAAQELAVIYPGGIARIGGVRRGRRDRQKRQWNKLERGDVVLFMKEDTVFLSGTVTYTLQSAELAQEIWGTDSKGRLAECIYFLGELSKRRIPRATINRLCGYDRAREWDGFSVQTERKSANVLYAFKLESQVYFPIVEEAEYREIVERYSPAEPLDATRHALMRKEEGFLRAHLFKGKALAECAICGRSFPTEFLAASHVKKWSECTVDERLDYKNIAIPLCHFGCLELYRRNYLTVIDERVAITTAQVDSTDLKAYLTKVKGRVCTFWRGSETYFEWHTDHGLYF